MSSSGVLLLPRTAEFLFKLVVSNSSSNFYNKTDVLNSLFRALELDGSRCEHANSFYSQPEIESNTNYLRKLGGASDESDFTTAVAMVIVCLVCAGLASGLTQGLLSLDFMEMTIKSRSGTPNEKLYAAKVLPVISRHHLLLVTLMLWNASATEAMPVFLSRLVPEYLAIILSVTMVLFVGEIIPAAILTGPKQLQIAASLIPLVYLVNIIFFPIAYPISLVLDYVLGHDEGMTVYNRREIATLMVIQHEQGARNALQTAKKGKIKPPFTDSLHFEEVTIIDGALKFRDMAG
jgi:CBS domain containing-hemolysin-like protein